MAETGKTLRHMLLGKIHRAVVTRADLDYVGSITIDEDLIDAAGFLVNEKVDIYDVTNGARLATYVIAAPRGSGEIGINGAAAHLVKPSDLVIIASYGWMKEKAARKHEPQIVIVDQENRPTSTVHEEHNPSQDPFGHLAAKGDEPANAATHAPAADDDDDDLEEEADVDEHDDEAKDVEVMDDEGVPADDSDEPASELGDDEEDAVLVEPAAAPKKKKKKDKKHKKRAKKKV